MPTDHLTTTDPAVLIAAIEQLVAGGSPDDLAANAGITTTELLDAADTYRAAGRIAITDQPSADWYQAHVTIPNWDNAHRIVADRIAPHLDDLCRTGTATGWWYIRKHPHWRIRINAANPDTTTELADHLNRLRRHLLYETITTWRPTIYEPETTAFGGPAGMDIAHGLFAADARHCLDHHTDPSPAAGIRETTLVLIGSLCRGAGLDWFETLDVWHHVARLRPRPDNITDTQLRQLGTDVTTLLHATLINPMHLLGPGRPLHPIATWAATFTTAGRALADAATTGNLHRGLRAVLGHHVIFHWNRLGLPTRHQILLTHATIEGEHQ